MQQSRRWSGSFIFAFTVPWIALTSSPRAQELNEQSKLVASDAADFDSFGVSVSISADTAVAGAYQDTTAAGLAAGSAYVFVRDGTGWTEQAKLVANDAAANPSITI